MAIEWTCDKCNTKNEFNLDSSEGELLLEMKTAMPSKKEYIDVCKKCGKPRKLIVNE